MPTQAPWTEIGRLQSDLSDVKRQLNNKAENHEIHTLNIKVDSMERSMRELSSNIDELRYRIEDAENKITQVESSIES